MKSISKIFLKRKILVYGLGKSGLSSLKFLQNKSEVYAYDDFITKIKSPRLKKKIIKYNKIQSFNFDQIILSPGIDINNCKLSNFLKKINIKFILIWMYFTHFIKTFVLQSLEQMENLQLVKFYMKYYISKILM